MKHVSTYNKTLRQIQEMKGKEIVCESGKKNKDGKVVWKIEDEVDEDVFRNQTTKNFFSLFKKAI